MQYTSHIIEDYLSTQFGFDFFLFRNKIHQTTHIIKKNASDHKWNENASTIAGIHSSNIFYHYDEYEQIFQNIKCQHEELESWNRQ